VSNLVWITSFKDLQSFIPTGVVSPPKTPIGPTHARRGKWLTQWQIAEETAGGQGTGRSASNLLQQQMRGILLEADGHSDVVDAQKSAASEWQIHALDSALDSINRPMTVCCCCFGFWSRHSFSFLFFLALSTVFFRGFECNCSSCYFAICRRVSNKSRLGVQSLFVDWKIYSALENETLVLANRYSFALPTAAPFYTFPWQCVYKFIFICLSTK